MFTQKCFIRKNTPELVKKLEELGYELVVVGRHSRERWIFCYDKYAVSRSEAIIGRDWIDCGTNEELFLAIAALRDDDISLNDKINEINKKYGTKIEFRR